MTIRRETLIAHEQSSIITFLQINRDIYFMKITKISMF